MEPVLFHAPAALRPTPLFDRALDAGPPFPPDFFLSTSTPNLSTSTSTTPHASESSDSGERRISRGVPRTRASSFGALRAAAGANRTRPHPHMVLLPFRPLTPILSPSLTTSASVSPATASDSDGVQNAFACGFASGIGTGAPAVDYLTKGAPAPALASTPSWIATPPTPANSPPKRAPSIKPSRSRTDMRPSTSSSASSGFALEDPEASHRRRAFSCPGASPLPSPSADVENAPVGLGLATPEVTQPVRAKPVPRRPPLFHIPTGTSDEHADDEGDEDGDGDGLFSDEHRDGARRTSDQTRARVRRYHALSELLSTEASYLQDLRILVTVYLEQLSSIVSQSVSPSAFTYSATLGFGRISPTTSRPGSRPGSSRGHRRTNSGPIVPPVLGAGSASGSGSSSGAQSTSTVTTSPDANYGAYKEKEKRLLTDEQLATLRRNAAQLLELHEWFVAELVGAIAPLGFRMPGGVGAESATDAADREEGGAMDADADATDEAVTVTMTRFAEHAARFDAYEAYCARQTEAADLVRRVQRENPVEWDAYEQRCSLIVMAAREPQTTVVASPDAMERDEPLSAGAVASSGLGSALPLVDETSESYRERKKRRHSMSSMTSSAVGGPKLHPSWWGSSRVAHGHSPLHADTAPLPSASAGHRGQAGRLTFLDYMMKPVQRICKYPLLFDQLRRRGPSAAVLDPDDAVENAARAMRSVVARVDAARDRQDACAKAALVLARLFRVPSHPLSNAFLASLGSCALVGSLDVVRPGGRPYAAGGVVDAKHLGAFLYRGGYLVMAKITEGRAKSRVYEPRHWFSLGEAEVCDVAEDEALLPNSFDLTVSGHTFSLTAACAREKEIWLSALREAQNDAPAWENEPVSSLQREPPRTEMHLDSPIENLARVSPVRAIPESAISALTSSPTDVHPPSPAERRPSLRALPPSRRSSTASVKAIFSAATVPDMLIRRVTLSQRKDVHRALSDVLSTSIISARFQAETRDEVLFPSPKAPGGAGGNLSRANSALSMASIAAKDRLCGRESVLVLRRGHSLIDVPSIALSESESGSGDVSTRPPPVTIARSKSRTLVMNKLQMRKMLVITPVAVPLPTGIERTPLSVIGQSPADDPHPRDVPAIDPPVMSSTPTSPRYERSMPSSAPPFNPDSPVAIPAEFLAVGQRSRPKRTRSMVDNVRDFFSSRSTSPLSPSPSQPNVSSGTPTPPAMAENGPSSPSSLKPRWWSRGSLRRRVRSAPETPDEQASTAAELSTPAMTPAASNERLDVPLEDEQATLRPSSSLMHPFGSSTRKAFSPARRRSIKHVLFFQRTGEEEITSTD